MKKIFLVYPNYKNDLALRDMVDEYEKQLEADGCDVMPVQRGWDTTGLKDLQINTRWILEADEVHFMGLCPESYVYLGVAFTLNKKIVPVRDFFPRPTNQASFQNVVYALEAIHTLRGKNGKEES